MILLNQSELKDKNMNNESNVYINSFDYRTGKLTPYTEEQYAKMIEKSGKIVVLPKRKYLPEMGRKESDGLSLI